MKQIYYPWFLHFREGEADFLLFCYDVVLFPNKCQLYHVTRDLAFCCAFKISSIESDFFFLREPTFLNTIGNRCKALKNIADSHQDITVNSNMHYCNSDKSLLLLPNIYVCNFSDIETQKKTTR